MGPEYTRRFVHALDDGGFDWTLVAYGSPSPDSLQLGQFVANNSERVKPMIAHRPGFQFPTQVAKAFAGLERISGGRVGIHIISGGSDAEQRREGGYTTKDERYERSDEFIQILRRVWYEDGPISFHGKHYRFEDFETEIKPVHGEIPISVGGSSPQAYDVGGRLGDIFRSVGGAAEGDRGADRVRELDRRRRRAPPSADLELVPPDRRAHR